MSPQSICPDYSGLEVAMDAWSEPFWRAGEKARLAMPRCTACGTFRWPAGPFCPRCHAQPVDWLAPGQPRLYSFTALPVPGADKDAPPAVRIPALAEFDDAPGVGLRSLLIDAEPGQVAIGAALTVEWRPAANSRVPVFRLAAPDSGA
jgi:uncharacterized OB-fold protein